MMTMRAWGGLLVMEFIGGCVLTLLCSDLRRWGLAAKLGLSFYLGLAVLTISLFLASLVGLKPVWWFGVLEFVALFFAVAVFRRQQLTCWWSSQPTAKAGQSPSFEIVLTVFIAGICGVVSAVSLVEPLVEWDVISIWALKAKVLLREPAGTTSYFYDVTKAYSHLDYPLLWPFALAWVWSWAGDADLQIVKASAPALLWASTGLCYGLLRRRGDRFNALLFTAMLIGLPMLLSQTSRIMADPVLSFFVMAAFVCCFLWIESGHPDDLRLTGFFTAGMLFTKNEGMGLFLILIIMAFCGLLAQKKFGQMLSAAIWLLVVPLAMTAAWFAFRWGIPKVHEDYGARINPLCFLNNISRIPKMAFYSSQYWANAGDWLIFWPLFLLAVIVSPRHWIRQPAKFLIMAAALSAAMYGYVYVVSPWELSDLMEVTANRLLLQIAPLCVFVMAETMRASGLLVVPVLTLQFASSNRR
jgi:hypothetical protein